MQQTELSREALVNRLRQFIVDLDAFYTDCTRAKYELGEVDESILLWAQNISRLSLRHAEELGVVSKQGD